MKAILKQLEKKIIEEYKDKKRNKDFIKEHYKHSLELINPIVSDGNTIINEYQYNIMMHLFNLASSIEYIPSIFIKQIASLSLFKNLEITGFSKEVQTSNKPESTVMKLQQIKEMTVCFSQICQVWICSICSNRPLSSKTLKSRMPRLTGWPLVRSWNS